MDLNTLITSFSIMTDDNQNLVNTAKGVCQFQILYLFIRSPLRDHIFRIPGLTYQWALCDTELIVCTKSDNSLLFLQVYFVSPPLQDSDVLYFKLLESVASLQLLFFLSLWLFWIMISSWKHFLLPFSILKKTI